MARLNSKHTVPPLPLFTPLDKQVLRLIKRIYDDTIILDKHSSPSFALPEWLYQDGCRLIPAPDNGQPAAPDRY